MKSILKKTLDEIVSMQSTIDVYGLGYVGFPLSVRLASHGFFVNGIDVNKNRIERLQNDQLHESEIKLKNFF